MVLELIFLTTVVVDKALAEELVDLKLSQLKKDIHEIMEKWHYHSAEKFLRDSKDGAIEEAEDDAITLRHLLDQREELFQLKNS